MMRRQKTSALMLLSLVLAASLLSATSAQTVAVPQRLSVQYYARSCPKAPLIVRNALYAAAKTNPRLAPQLVRLLFHDCFVKGCEASILLDGLDENPAEKNASPNQSLGGFEFIDAVKKKVEAACKATVSCADILAMSARDSVAVLGGPKIPIRLGRLDGKTTSSGDTIGRIPDPATNLSAILPMFQQVNLNVVDLVALSGAHSIGKGLCKHFQNRLVPRDVTMNVQYKAGLLKACGGGGATFSQMNLANLDPVTPGKFDNQYYKNLYTRRGLFTSDQVLVTDRRTAALSKLYAYNTTAFYQQFSRSFIKMSEFGVLGKPFGEVRTDCRLPRAISGN